MSLYKDISIAHFQQGGMQTLMSYTHHMIHPYQGKLSHDPLSKML